MLMLIPSITIHISGAVLAVYGAILSTITVTVQIITHFKDRAHLKIADAAQHEEMIAHRHFFQRILGSLMERRHGGYYDSRHNDAS
jgi:hypothetical protein